MKKGKIYIGTSGWHYEHWKGPFYPTDLPSKDFLNFYLKSFSTVEMNRTFYSLPAKKVFSDYAKKVPSNFIFSVKASRYITHIKRLKSPKVSLNRLFSRLEGFGDHLGPVLFQFPPHWNLNPERLQAFLEELENRHRYVFEFRDPSWWTEEIYNLLSEYHSAFCIHDFQGKTTPLLITADFIYIRLHGPRTAYSGKYSLNALKKWARFIQEQVKTGKDVYCYFNNDEAGYAVENAKTLLQLS